MLERGNLLFTDIPINWSSCIFISLLRKYVGESFLFLPQTIEQSRASLESRKLCSGQVQVPPVWHRINGEMERERSYE